MLSPLVYWAISGKLGIKTEQESHSTLLNWNQQDDRYHIYVTTPIGTSVAQINNDGHAVELVLSKTEKYQSNSLDELLWKQLGWSLPADHLFYWVRGLPAPAAVDSYQVDAQFHLIKLTQSGWSISYTDYMNVRGYALPKKMVITHPDLKLTLLISEWRISDVALPPS
jgi:outer membrane lipoprotein LolB